MPTLTASCTGGTGITYVWTNPSGTNTNGATVSATQAGTYTWTCTDSQGCSATGTYTVNILTQPSVTINATNICSGGCQIINATGVPSGYTYAWNFGSGTPSTSTATSANVCFNTIGSTTVTLVITNTEFGCQWTYTKNVTVGQLTGSATCN